MWTPKSSVLVPWPCINTGVFAQLKQHWLGYTSSVHEITSVDAIANDCFQMNVDFVMMCTLDLLQLQVKTHGSVSQVCDSESDLLNEREIVAGT